MKRSWIIPNEIIDNYLCLCLHPSKLPEYRGGSPIQNQIIDGVKNSAVTIFKMNDELDSGDIYYQRELNFEGYLDDILNRIKEVGIIGTEYIIKNIKNIVPKKQEDSTATYCKRRKLSDSEITLEDFKNYDSEYFYNKIRCLQYPYPEAFIKCKSGKIILQKIKYEK